MKFKLNPSPNYHCGASTRKIMFELTVCLLVVFAFALVYQFVAHGIGNVIHVLILMASALGTAVACEVLWALFVAKTSFITLLLSF